MLSIIILTKNSQDTIKRTLKSIEGFGDEVLVIDSDSNDDTKKIVKGFDIRMVEKKFIDFSDQRNYGIDRTSGEWVLYVDSDEELTEDFKNEVKEIISKTDVMSGYYLQRKTYYFGKDWGLIDKVQRLFLRKKFIGWYGLVHETPKIEGEFGVISSPINHFTHSNLFQMVNKTNDWSNFEAELRLKSKHPRMTILRFCRIILTGFISSYLNDKGYKNGTKGMIESIYQSFSMFITYAKLWEKQNN